MTQSLSNLMNSPLATVALLLWVLLAVLAVKQCRRWSKSEKNEKFFYQNHPAIPTKEYKLSEFMEHEAVDDRPKLILVNKQIKPKLDPEKQIERLATLKNAWDV